MVLHFALDLFGRKIGRRSDQAGGARNLSGEASDAKVTEFDLAVVGDKDVRGFYISMDDAGLMSAAECIGEVAGPDAGTGQGNGAFFQSEHRVERLARHILRDEVSAAVVVGAEIEDGDDVGMGKTAEDLGFAKKLLLQLR